MANEKQIPLYDEIDDCPDERMPNVVELRPELQLAWRGLTIVIAEGQMTRKQAVEMLKSWDMDRSDEPA